MPRSAMAARMAASCTGSESTSTASKSKMIALIAASVRAGALSSSAVASREHAEEGLDVRVRAGVAVAVVVGVPRAGRAAVAAQAGEEGLTVEVGADVA